MQPQLDDLLPASPGVFAGGRPYTQALDIGHACALVIEKGLDAGSAAIAQADIKSNFDSLPLLSIIMWPQRRGISASLLAAVLRLQLFTRLVVCVGSCRAVILNRTVGGLTGSLTALLCSRVPVESTLLELRQDLQTFALDLGTFRLCAAS